MEVLNIPSHCIVLQTGSGKTYSITGSSKSYNNRGLIPRSIEKIFQFINTVIINFHKS